MMNKNIRFVAILLFISVFVGAIIYTIYTSEKSQEDSGELNTSRFKDKKSLTIVTDYSPIGYFVKGDSIMGFNSDLVKLFQSYTNLKLELVLESSLEKSIEGLKIGKYDIVARSIPITLDLKDVILFSEPMTQSKQLLVQRKLEYNDSIAPVRSHLDLAGKTLYVPKLSPVILRINNLSNEIGDTIYYIEDDVYGEEQLVIMVAQKEIDFAVCDEKTAKTVAKTQPELDLETSIGFTQLEAWAVSQNEPELLDTLNSWIEKAKQEKETDKIYKKYLH